MRVTTRRLIVFIAAAALVLSAVHPSGPRPGLYLRVGGACLGACRDDHSRTLDGGPPYWAGVWSGDRGALVAGLAIGRGRVALRSPSGWRAIW